MAILSISRVGNRSAPAAPSFQRLFGMKRAEAAGARVVSRGGIVSMRTGTRVVMVRDPDVGMFVELFEEPQK